jgi:putative intracellular protease/amidase
VPTVGRSVGFWGKELTAMALLDDTPKLSDLDLEDYDAIMIVGGLAPMFGFRDDELPHKSGRLFRTANDRVA